MTASNISQILSIFGILLFIGCGGGDRPSEGDLTGNVQIDGSSTVYPITEAVAEEFMREHPQVRVTVGLSGTGGGFSKFLRGETDISNASRPIKASEAAQARENNVEFVELPVAYDGLAVVVNPANDWVDCLTVDELRRIWEPGSTVNNWNQVRPEFPNSELKLYGPGTDSGTYDYFTEAVAGESGASRADFTASEDDNVLVQGIAGDPSALGYFGLAYYEENQQRLKLLGIDGGNGCIQPTPETVENGSYAPLSRPLFIYVRKDRVQDPAIAAFVEFYVEHSGELAPEVGYVALSDEAYDLTMQRFNNGVTGSLFEDGGRPGITMQELLRSEMGSGGDSAAVDTSASPSAPAL